MTRSHFSLPGECKLDGNSAFLFLLLIIPHLRSPFNLGYNGVIMILLLVIFAYILGSIPFGLIVGKFSKVDITKTGSGNIGATNVLRALGPKAGAMVFILDMLKGTVPVLLAGNLLNDPVSIILVGLASIVGHMFSVFMNFKGGKGAAVSIGVLLGIAPDVFFFTALIVIAVILITRYVSLGSIIGSIITVILMLLFQKPMPYFWMSIIAAAFIIIKHKDNISRLLSGTERKL